MESLKLVWDAILRFISNYMGETSLATGIVMLFILYTTTKKVLKIIAFVLIVIGAIIFIPKLMGINLTQYAFDYLKIMPFHSA